MLIAGTTLRKTNQRKEGQGKLEAGKGRKKESSLGDDPFLGWRSVEVRRKVSFEF